METNTTTTTYKFKLLKLPSFLTSSCKTQNLKEVISHNNNEQSPIFLKSPLITKTQDNEVESDEKYPFQNLVIKSKQMNNHSLPPTPIHNVSSSSYSSASTSLMMCNPRNFENYINAGTRNRVSSRKVGGKHSIMLSPLGDFDDRKCPPPASPASPLFQKQGKMEKKMKNKNKLKRQLRNNYGMIMMKNGFKKNPFSFSSSSSSSNESDNNGGWFSSDDEREEYEKQTMLSLKSLSFSSKSISISSESDTLDHNNLTQTRTQTQVRDRVRARRRRPKPTSRLREETQTHTQTQIRTQTQVRRQKSTSRLGEVGVGPLDTSESQTQTQIQVRRQKSTSRLGEVGVGPQTQTQTQVQVKRKMPSFRSKNTLESLFDNADTQAQTQTQTLETGLRLKEVGVDEDTFAVVKSSSDPYNDFRTSMLEMIIEKQIFGAKELKQLLECFISLNSSHHHRMILKVYDEICDALFSHCS